MIRAKVYDTYYPYRVKTDEVNGYINENGEGIEYCLDNTEEETIDYNNYYHSSFDLFWDNLLNRFEQYKNVKPDIDYDLATKKTIFQNILLNIYEQQKLNKFSDPYYCYVDMLSDNFKNICTTENSSVSSLNLNIDINLLEFLINQNLYIKPKYIPCDHDTVKPGVNYYIQEGTNPIIYTLVEDEDFNTFTPGVDYFLLDSCYIDNVQNSDYEVIRNSYKDVKFYMGVDKFEDLNGQIVQKFHYYEFKLKSRKIQHRIKQLRIDAPIGTTFYLNRVLHPITVYQYQNSFMKDNTKGYYIIEPEDYINIKYITFPKDAIIKYETKLNPNWTSDMGIENLTISAGSSDWCLTVSYTYNDEYDIEYVDE